MEPVAGYGVMQTCLPQKPQLNAQPILHESKLSFSELGEI
jgi:hypothetical protein